MSKQKFFTSTLAFEIIKIVLISLVNRVSSENSTLANHTDIIWSLNFASDSTAGRFLISGSLDTNINLWSPVSTNWSLNTQINNGVSAVGVIPIPNQQMATIFGSSIKLWNFSSQTLIKTLSEHSSGVTQLALSPNQLMIASASNDFTSKVWNISSGECISTMYGHTNYVRSVVFYSNDILITGSYDKTIKVWSIKNGTGSCLKTLTGHTGNVLSFALMSNGLLASGSNEIIIWNVTNGSCLATLTGHTKSVRGLVWLSNGMLASGAQDNTIKIWNMNNYYCVQVNYFVLNRKKKLSFL
jgi:WD40 repeat protein